MKEIRQSIKWGMVVLLGLLLSSSLMAKPIVVSINDVPNGPPVIQVQGAPNGYNVYTGSEVATPGVEDGALITLFGVNNYFDPGALPEWGGRFVIPIAPNPFRTAVDIVWVSHDADVFGLGDLQVGFNSAFPGTWYINPEFRGDENLGLVTDNWVTVYATDTLVIRYKPHTYRLTVERPLKEAGLISFTPASELGGTFGVVGTATHLGKFVGKGTYEVTGVDGALVFFHVAATWTAANGDSIEIDCPEWVNDNSVTPPTSTGVMKIIGGTGRFADASGSFIGDISPAVITPGAPNTLTAEGTISY